MFDTHAHLNFQEFDGRESDIINNCRILGVQNILIPGTGLKTSQKALEIAEHHEGIYAATGIHPADVTDNPPKTETAAGHLIPMIREIASRSAKVKAIGEIGLDRYYIFRKLKTFDKELFQQQVNMFVAQFRLAKELKKSVIIHSRQSKKDLIRVLENNWDRHYTNNVVLHCCEPYDQLLDFAIEHDIYLGVDGDVTYDEKKMAFVHKIPLNRLVLETDTPFLTPSPIRDNLDTGYPNSPEHLPIIAEKVAQIKDIDTAEVVRETTRNAKQLFNL